jgi:hypothetical protein
MNMRDYPIIHLYTNLVRKDMDINESYMVPQGKFITKSLCIGLISCQSYVVAQGKFITKSLCIGLISCQSYMVAQGRFITKSLCIGLI